MFGLSFLLPQYTQIGFFVNQLLLFILLGSIFLIIVYYVYVYYNNKGKDDFIDVEFIVLKIITTTVMLGGLAIISYLQLNYIDLNLTPPIEHTTYFDQYGYYIHRTPYDYLEPVSIGIIKDLNNQLVIDFIYENPDYETAWHTRVRTILTYDDLHRLTSYSSEMATNYDQTSYQSIKISFTFVYTESSITETLRELNVIKDDQTFTSYDYVSLYDFETSDQVGEEGATFNYIKSSTNFSFSVDVTRSIPYIVDTNTMYTGTLDSNHLNIIHTSSSENLMSIDFNQMKDYVLLSDDNYWQYTEIDHIWISDPSLSKNIKIHDDYTYIPNIKRQMLYESPFGMQLVSYKSSDDIGKNDVLATRSYDLHHDYRLDYFNDPNTQYSFDWIADCRSFYLGVTSSANTLFILNASESLVFNPAIIYMIDQVVN